MFNVDTVGELRRYLADLPDDSQILWQGVYLTKELTACGRNIADEHTLIVETGGAIRGAFHALSQSY